MRNASLGAGAINHSGIASSTVAQTPATRRTDVLALGWLGTRRMLARVICAGAAEVNRSPR